jgi:hypothetical protein
VTEFIDDNEIVVLRRKCPPELTRIQALNRDEEMVKVLKAKKGQVNYRSSAGLEPGEALLATPREPPTTPLQSLLSDLSPLLALGAHERSDTGWKPMLRYSAAA